MNNQRHLLAIKRKNKAFKYRIIRAVAIVFALTIVLVLRLAYLQLAQYKVYTTLAKQNQLEILPIEPNRGLIYDRNGILLAENIPAFSLNITPDKVKNLRSTVSALQKIIEISPEQTTQFFRTVKHHRAIEPIPLKLKLNQEEIASFYVNKYQFPGVTIDAAMIRHYPLEENISSVLGYVGRINSSDLQTIDAENYRANNFIGKMGIEKYFEAELHGKTGYKEVEVDASGHTVRILRHQLPVPGNNLYLTIDSKLQCAAHQAIGEGRGSIVAINPQNGEVLALVSHPSYNPNLFSQGIDNATFQKLITSADKPMYNRAVRGHFPLASTIKPFIAIQGLDTGTINTHTSIHDPGWFKLPNSRHIYRDWVHNGHGTVNIIKAITVSCDTFFYGLAVQLGIDRIDNILERFGFGSKTGIELTEELPGIVASPKWKMAHTGNIWYPGDTVISGIGQGFMATTPVQLANAVATIATRGTQYQAHLLLKSQQADGTTVTTKPIVKTLVKLKSSNTWEIVINAMRDVITSQIGTARTRFGTDMPYTVAGKTGGAQLFHHKIVNENPVPENENSIPKHLRNHTLFIAFAPIKNPKIALAVIAENSSVAPVIARKVIDHYLLQQTP